MDDTPELSSAVLCVVLALVLPLSPMLLIYIMQSREDRARGVVGYHARLALKLREGSGSIPDVSRYS